MKKTNQILSLLIAVLILAMPMGTAVFNNGNRLVVHANDMEEIISDKAIVSLEDSISDNEAEEINCTCENKCTKNVINTECLLCREHFESCKYQEPKVKITVSAGKGWYRNKAKVTILVKDTLKTGNFEISSVEAKIGENGSWIDITEEMKMEIAENCTIYVQVTDTKENLYAATKYIECFDTDKPTLNAAIQDGLLSVQAADRTSGIKAIYVNGYEFTDLTNGTLSIRLQQFDTGYENFTIQAKDEAGNLSDVYKMQNPYYQDPQKQEEKNGNGESEEALPASAEATVPTDAKATVIEHTVNGEDKSSGNLEEENVKEGKEFYTIQTKSEKIFYLVIDKEQSENNVYLLTEVSENDLLNFNESNSVVLPQNSAVIESALPISQNDVIEEKNITEVSEDQNEKEPEKAATAKEKEGKNEKEPSSNDSGTYIILLLVAVGVCGGYYLKKFVKDKKNEVDDDDFEYEDEQEGENEVEEENIEEQECEEEEVTTEQEMEEEEDTEKDIHYW